MSAYCYQPSGRVPSTAPAIALLFACALLPCAWVYAWLIQHAPVGANFFFACAYAVVIGVLTTQVARRAKVRNPVWMGRAGLALSLLGCYLQWAAWAGLKLGVGYATVAADPRLLLQLMGELVSGADPAAASAHFSGFWLVVLWLGEGVMLLTVAPTLGRARAAEPFCEEQNSWSAPLRVPCKFRLIDSAQARALTGHDLSALLALLTPWRPDDSASYTELVLYRCGAGDSCVSIIDVLVSQAENAPPEEKRRPLLEYLLVPDTDVDVLLRALAALAPVGTESVQDSSAPIAAELTPALAQLHEERYTEVLALATPHLGASVVSVRADAKRLCALACCSLGRWEAARSYFASLFDDEASAHNALQVATCSVMAGALAQGQSWLERAQAINAASRELPGMLLLTNFVSSLVRAGHAQSALPWLEQIRQVYMDIGVTDPTFLTLRKVPMFSAFLHHSVPVLRAALLPVQIRSWYERMLPALDAAGKSALREWMAETCAPEHQQS